MVATLPLFQYVRAVAQGVFIAVPRGITLFQVTVVLREYGITFSHAPLLQIRRVDGVVIYDKGVIVDHLDVIYVVTRCCPNALIGISNRIIGKDHIFCGHFLAVCPENVIPELPGDVHGPFVFIHHHAAIFHGWQLERQLRIDLIVWIHIGQTKHDQLLHHPLVASEG